MTDNQRRVVITGVGLVSPLGNSPRQLWSALESGTSGVSAVQQVPSNNLPIKFAGEARDFTGSIDEFGDLDKTLKRSIRKGLKLMCREIEMGVCASQHAMADAHLDFDSIDRNTFGTLFGADYIMTKPEEFTDGIQLCKNGNSEIKFSDWGSVGLPKVDPLWLLKYLPNMPASHVAIYNDLRGPSNSITVREASSNLAIAEGATIIRRGTADMMVIGSTGSRIHPLKTTYVALQEDYADQSLEPGRACRPFDRDRTGMVIGEGAGAIILETLESAKRRGGRIYGEIIGYGSSTVIDRFGVANYARAFENVIRGSLEIAGMEPQELGHIHAHGIATKRCDTEEGKAIAAVFGTDQPPVTAAKSYMGNLGAGGGIVETIASLLSLQNDRLFPVLNFENADPDCPVNVARESLSPGNSFLNMNITPQGQAAAIICRKID